MVEYPVFESLHQGHLDQRKSEPNVEKSEHDTDLAIKKQELRRELLKVPVINGYKSRISPYVNNSKLCKLKFVK